MTTPTLEEVAEEARELIPEDKLTELLAEHPGAYYTTAEASDGPVAVVFKRLSQEQFKRAQAMADDKNRKGKMAQTLWRDVVLYPKGEAEKALLEDCPAIDDQVAALALEIARGKAPEEAKKLRTSPRRPLATR
jgi:hypothetical protein